MADLFQERGIKPPGTDLLQQRGIAPPNKPAPQAEPEQLGMVESFGQGAAQGATLGFADELYGAGAALIPGGQNYDEAVKAARARLARSNPAAALAGELAGSLILPGGAAKSGASLGVRALRGALAGATVGGVGAVGRAEGNLAERVPEAIPGAALGGSMGAAGAAVAPAITRGAQRLIRGRQDQTAVQGLIETISQGGDVGATSQAAVRGIQKAQKGSKAAVTAAYDKIATFQGKVEDQAAFDLLSAKFGKIIDDEGVIHLESAERITGLVDRVIHTMRKGATPKDMDQARKLIAKVGRNVSDKNPGEGRILRGLKGEFDDWTFDTLTNKLYRGDETAVKQIKEARGLATEYHKMFSRYTGDSGSSERTAGGMIHRIITDDVEAVEASNMLFGLSNAGIKGSRQALARIRDVSPEAFEQLQGAHFIKMLTGPNNGDFLSAKQIARNVDKLNASGLAKTLYGDRLPEINRFAKNLAAKPSIPKAVAEFVRSRPALLGFVLGTTGGAAVTGGDPMVTTFGAILGTALGKGKGAPAAAKQLQKAARPVVDTLTTRRAGQVGGTVGAIFGPSLAGG
ncbi:hypothetical protein N9980_01880 [bacterium]|nr:hypothetical protein [bacterium]